MTQHTKLLNLPIYEEAGYTPITRTKFVDLPVKDSGCYKVKTADRSYVVYKAYGKELPDLNLYCPFEKKYIVFELFTKISFPNGSTMHVRESGIGAKEVRWEIDLFGRDGERLAYESDNSSVIFGHSSDNPIDVRLYKDGTIRQRLGHHLYYTTHPVGRSHYEMVLIDLVDDVVDGENFDGPGVRSHFHSDGSGDVNQVPFAFTDLDEFKNRINTLKRMITENDQSLGSRNVLGEQAIKDVINSYKEIVDPKEILFKGF